MSSAEFVGRWALGLVSGNEDPKGVVEKSPGVVSSLLLVSDENVPEVDDGERKTDDEIGRPV